MNEQRIKKVLLFCGVIFMVLFCSIPFLWMVIISLNKHPDFLLKGSAFVFSFDNYFEIISTSSTHILQYLLNSFIISFTAAFLATLFAALSAYSISRFSFPGRAVIPILLLGLSMFPQISIVGYLFKIMTGVGWINTYYALIFPYITLGLPLALWIMLSYLSKISKELDKAALVDGASRMQIFFKIIFPVSLPGILSTFVLVFIYAFNEFLFALMLTIDYNARTIPVGIALFEGLHGQIPWGYIMAASVIAVIPVLLLIAFFQKYIIQGLTEGAVKG